MELLLSLCPIFASFRVCKLSCAQKHIIQGFQLAALSSRTVSLSTIAHRQTHSQHLLLCTTATYFISPEEIVSPQSTHAIACYATYWRSTAVRSKHEDQRYNSIYCTYRQSLLTALAYLRTWRELRIRTISSRKVLTLSSPTSSQVISSTPVSSKASK